MAIYSLNVGRIGRTTHCSGTAAAHARYILRKSAASAALSGHMPRASKAVQDWLNAQEKGDRKNARVIEKIMAALPRELHPLQRQKLVRDYCERITKGRAPWLAAIHDKGKDAGNPHAHIIIRDRDIETGRRVAKLSEKGSCEWLRKLWAELANEALSRAGQKARIDHRSLREQGIAATPGRHRGRSSRPAVRESRKGALSTCKQVSAATPSAAGVARCVFVPQKLPCGPFFPSKNILRRGAQPPVRSPPDSRSRSPPQRGRIFETLPLGILFQQRSEKAPPWADGPPASGMPETQDPRGLTAPCADAEMRPSGGGF